MTNFLDLSKKGFATVKIAISSYFEENKMADDSDKGAESILNFWRDLNLSTNALQSIDELKVRRAYEAYMWFKICWRVQNFITLTTIFAQPNLIH